MQPAGQYLQLRPDDSLHMAYASRIKTARNGTVIAATRAAVASSPEPEAGRPADWVSLSAASCLLTCDFQQSSACAPIETTEPSYPRVAGARSRPSRYLSRHEGRSGWHAGSGGCG